MTPHADTEFKSVYNICDRVRLNLPSGMSDCSLQNHWRLLPNLTTDNHQTVPGTASSKKITLNMPSQFGVYCAQQCNDPNQEYCAAIAGKWDNCVFEDVVFKGSPHVVFKYKFIS